MGMRSWAACGGMEVCVMLGLRWGSASEGAGARGHGSGTRVHGCGGDSAGVVGQLAQSDHGLLVKVMGLWVHHPRQWIAPPYVYICMYICKLSMRVYTQQMLRI
jgi:hypothetical protein